MHCPFCVNADNFHDPVILKAHYRVKHVDKGIDFAGMNILHAKKKMTKEGDYSFKKKLLLVYYRFENTDNYSFKKKLLLVYYRFENLEVL